METWHWSVMHLPSLLRIFVYNDDTTFPPPFCVSSSATTTPPSLLRAESAGSSGSRPRTGGCLLPRTCSSGWPSARAGVDLSLSSSCRKQRCSKLTAGPWFLTPSCSGPAEVCRGMIHHVQLNIFQYIGCQIESKIHILIFTVPTKY
jgi:hypothetical protein